jgi:ribosomal protein L32
MHCSQIWVVYRKPRLIMEGSGSPELGPNQLDGKQQCSLMPICSTIVLSKPQNRTSNSRGGARLSFIIRPENTHGTAQAESSGIRCWKHIICPRCLQSTLTTGRARSLSFRRQEWRGFNGSSTEACGNQRFQQTVIAKTAAATSPVYSKSFRETSGLFTRSVSEDQNRTL